MPHSVHRAQNAGSPVALLEQLPEALVERPDAGHRALIVERAHLPAALELRPERRRQLVVAFRDRPVVDIRTLQRYVAAASGRRSS